MANLAKLVVQLEAQTAKYQRELKTANKKLDRFARNQNRQIKQVSNAFKLMAGVVASAVGFRIVAAFKKMVREAQVVADSLAKQSDILGIATEKLAAYRLAAELSGSDMGGLEKGIKKLQKSILDATNGLSTYTRAFDALKLDPEELKQLAPDEQFETLARAFTKLETNVEKVGIAYDLFGGRNTQLIKLLELVGDKMQKLEADTRAWGTALSRTDAAKVENANDAMTRARTALQGVATTLAVTLAPTLEKMANGFADLIAQAQGFKTEIQAILNFLGIADIFPWQEEIEDTEREIKRVADNAAALARLGLVDTKPFRDAQERLRELAADLADFKQKQRIALGLSIAIETDELEALPEKIDDTIAEFTIQKPIDVILRPDVQFDIVPLERSLDVLEQAFGDFEPIDELSIQTKLDAALRPLEEFDIKPLERTTEDFFAKLIADAEESGGAVEELGLTFESAFESAIIEGNKLRDVLGGLLKDIARLVARKLVVEPLANFVTEGLNQLFPGRALGGTVMAGETYIVGERGPEFFTPTRSGQIIPNSAVGGAVTNVFNIDSRTDRQQIVSDITMAMERTVQLTKSEIRNDINEGRF